MKILNSSDSKKNLKNVSIGDDVTIYDFVNLYDCEIGDNTKVGTFVEIQKNSKIGRFCKISSHSFICEGVSIGDNVFIGHGVMFINDLYPRASNVDGSLQADGDWILHKTHVERNASIGTNSTIMGGVIIGENSIVGAGAVVTKNVPRYSVVAGNPARIIGSIDE